MQQHGMLQRMQVPQMPIELLEHNPDRGVEFLLTDCENLDIYSTSFNPKQRILVAGGSNHMAVIWDLRQD